MMRPSRTMMSHLSRRTFLQTAGGTAAGLSLGAPSWFSSLALGQTDSNGKKPAVVRVAFIYPPTESLDKVGYYSWPGSTFDAEDRQRQYTSRLKQIEQKLGMRIIITPQPLDTADHVARFINEVKASRPQGLLLIPFKKGHWPHVTRIVEESQIPTVVLASLGILLVGHVRQLHRTPGVYMINSLDNLDAVERGMNMIRTAWTMRQSRIINIDGKETRQSQVTHLGTEVRTIPHARFYDAYKTIGTPVPVEELAETYMRTAEKIIQPTKDDIVDAAKTYFILKRLIEEEQADAVMMNCLPGLQRPHQHVPPCMGFMDLRDEGIPAGCESDLDATITMMLLQQLFDKPAFQHNPTVETETNHYFCAHCTSASKMRGCTEKPEPYVLMNHAEAGWGCVPRVLFTPGQEVTITKYLRVKSEDEIPQMLVYSGELLGCPPVPATGGCRTNAEATIRELEDVADLKGHHLCMVYGDYAKQLRQFCQLTGVEAVI